MVVYHFSDTSTFNEVARHLTVILPNKMTNLFNITVNFHWQYKGYFQMQGIKLSFSITNDDLGKTAEACYVCGYAIRFLL